MDLLLNVLYPLYNVHTTQLEGYKRLLWNSKDISDVQTNYYNKFYSEKLNQSDYSYQDYLDSLLQKQQNVN